MLAGAHKKFYCIQHPEIYLLDLKVQYKHKIKLPLDMVSKHVFLYLCLINSDISGQKTISQDISFLSHPVIALIKAQVCHEKHYMAV